MNQDSSPDNYPGNQYPHNRPQQGSPYSAPPGQSPYGQQNYAQPWRPTKPFSNKAIVSMVFAGCGLFLWPLGFILNLVGIGLGVSGMNDTHPDNGTHRGRALAVAGVWTNVGVWLLTVLIGVGMVLFFVTAFEAAEQSHAENQVRWADEDMRKIEERLELYYVENGSSLKPGGPVVRDGWNSGLYPDDHPRVQGQLTVNDLVSYDDIMHSPDDYDVTVTGDKSATITYRKSGRKLVITDIGSKRSRFEG